MKTLNAIRRYTRGVSALLLAALLASCGVPAPGPAPAGDTPVPQYTMEAGYTVLPEPVVAATTGRYAVNPDGMTVETRFAPPQGYERIPVESGSYEAYLRSLPLKADGASVACFDGTQRSGEAYAAVVDMDVGSRDLQQCADTVIRYRAEYLWLAQRREEIAFYFTSGFYCEWARYREGLRTKVDGDHVEWVQSAQADDSRESFRQYLDLVFTYAGTRSLRDYETIAVNPAGMRIGDMFLKGGSPGHVVQVADMAVNPQTGQKCFLLVQGYMPAQEGQILKSFEDTSLGPWYLLDGEAGGAFVTPEYLFDWEDLCRFKNDLSQ